IGGFPADGRILVLAGKGHNGGDALLAARAVLLAHPGASAVVVLVFGAGDLRPLVGRALDGLRQQAPARVQILPADTALAVDQQYALCLDGIFGFQFRAPMDSGSGQLIAQVNRHKGIRLRAAVDLPSGLGETSVPVAFRADFTYAAGSVKYPVLSPRHTGVVGRLRYVDIGLLQEDSVPEAAERILRPSLVHPLAGLRVAQSDKRTFGHLLLVGGSHSYPGAVVLAARAALRSGVGLVTAFVPESLAPGYAARHPEVMWVGCQVTLEGGLAAGTADLVRARAAKATALLIGPGLGAEAETVALAAHLAGEAKMPLVLDADALRPEVVACVRAKPFIGTPHAGEFERIAPALFTGGKFTAAQGVLVLKGPLTRVTDGKTIYHSPFGGPVLARGGSGDILAGLIGGLLAQHPAEPLLAACRGVVWHGQAADLLARTRGQVAVEISEILEHLGHALSPTPCQILP
ncbi:MAG TPA: NAD(P)H-hydrate dehydratase, partial [Lacunisphaera sp.]|nr:NAD(P)H-hydrate dehydratase [Lacunisphaera sp.]